MRLVLMLTVGVTLFGLTLGLVWLGHWAEHPSILAVVAYSAASATAFAGGTALGRAMVEAARSRRRARWRR